MVERKLRKISLKENWFRNKNSNPTPRCSTLAVEPQTAWGFGGKRRQPVQNTVVIKRRTVRLSSPVFIPATQNSYLLQKMKAEEDRMGDITGWKLNW